MNQQARILDALNHSGYQFLMSDLDVALTFTRIASGAGIDEDKRVRNLQNARRAYVTVQQLVPRVGLNGTQQRQVSERLGTLKCVLEKMGEHF